MTSRKMHIAMIGPVSMNLLAPVMNAQIAVPRSHGFGMNADLVNGLLLRGHSVDVVTLAPGAGCLFHLDLGPLRLWAVPTRFRVAALRLYMPEVRMLRRVLVENGRYDVIHAHWLYEYALAGSSLRMPTLVTVHDWPGYVFRNDISLVRFVKLLLSCFVIPKVRYASAPSQYMADVASKILGIKSVEVIANALPSSLLLEGDQEKPRGRGPVLVAINHGFSPRKNVSTLIEAMSLVRRVVPDATLRLIGSDYGRGESASAYASRKGMGDGIEFLGRLDRAEVLDELTAATAFVHPSREESFGLVLAEAMARRTPVIAGQNAGAVPWILEGGNSGALCDVESAEDLAKTIIEVIGSQELLARYAENGFKRVKSSFMMDQMITSFEQLYLRIASSNS